MPMENDPEVKNSNPKQLGAVVQDHDLMNLSTFSSWQLPLILHAFLSNARERARNRLPSDQYRKGLLVPEEIKQAEWHRIMLAQRDLDDWQKSFRDLAPFVKEGVVLEG